MGGFGGGFEMPAFAVNTTPAVRGQIRDYLALTGDIVAGSTVDVYSDTAGKVSQVYVSLGGRVARNQALLEIDPSRPGTTYMASVVRAPVAGTVVALPAMVGMTVSQQVPVARVAAGGALEVRVYVAERFISKMTPNLPCEIILDAYPGEVFQGSVAELAPVVDPASRTMEVTINVSNPGGRLKAGMFAKVKIFTEIRENTVKIPAAAMIERFGQTYIFVAENDPAAPGALVAKMRVIVPGIKIDEVLEVREGLAPDEDVLVKGHAQLFEGSRINVVERVPPLGVN
jgi:multidrug efflux pump subunit AcrA (membrane-fusion protein)